MDASSEEGNAGGTDGAATDRAPAVAADHRRHHLLAFALAVPLTVLLLTGVVDVSMNYTEGLQARNGTDDAGRDLAAQRLALNGVTDRDCWLDELTSAPGPIRAEACLVKARLHVDPHRARVRIVVVDDGGRWTSRRSSDNSIVVCTQVEARSVTGLLGFVYADQVHQRRTSVAIERLGDEPIESAWERPLPGTGWDWCRTDSPAP